MLIFFSLGKKGRIIFLLKKNVKLKPLLTKRKQMPDVPEIGGSMYHSLRNEELTQKIINLQEPKRTRLFSTGEVNVSH